MRIYICIFIYMDIQKHIHVLYVLLNILHILIGLLLHRVKRHARIEAWKGKRNSRTRNHGNLTLFPPTYYVHLHLCLCTCIVMYMVMYIYIYIHIYIYIYIYIYTYIYIYIYISIWICICTYMYIYVFMFCRTLVYMATCMWWCVFHWV